MNHFNGVTPEERYKNEQMDHLRKQTKLLEQIAQLLKPKGGVEIAKSDRNSQRRNGGENNLNR
ncbi:hypothetical protein PaeBR_18705 [Paenibacillus sp. BR2-3]|uniref:hypothetical protein n=1 Tax=Paenibacillus sp. BR2-3 TaxID=3048494 RepID=UPI0039776768